MKRCGEAMQYRHLDQAVAALDEALRVRGRWVIPYTSRVDALRMPMTAYAPIPRVDIVAPMLRVALLAGSLECRGIAGARLGFTLAGQLCLVYNTLPVLRSFLAVLTEYVNEVLLRALPAPLPFSADEIASEAALMGLAPPYPASFDPPPRAYGAAREEALFRVMKRLRDRRKSEEDTARMTCHCNAYGFEATFAYQERDEDPPVPLYIETCNGTPKIVSIGEYAFLIRRLDFHSPDVPLCLAPLPSP
jgi:hypothetical protein